jgi:AhpC/TSA antioxidant enzyme
LRDHEDRIREAGAAIAAVGLGDPHHARAFRDESGIGFPLLVDEDRRAYRAAGLQQASLLHLLRRDNAVARKRAARGGHRQRRLGKNPLQLGGSFVFGPGNVDLYAHVSATFGDNAAPENLLAAVSTG